VFSHPAEVLETVRRGQGVYRDHSWQIEKRRLTEMVAGLLCEGATQSIGRVEQLSQNKIQTS
jgi:hypothetical protein